MEAPTTNNLGHSVVLWITAQIMWIMSWTTDLELLFKVLSVISVTMVIIINARKCTHEIVRVWKNIFKKKR